MLNKLTLYRFLCEPHTRLGHSLSVIQNHPFFEGVEWSRIKERKPPFTPKLDGDRDTSYFLETGTEQTHTEHTNNASKVINISGFDYNSKNTYNV